jgi:hypothetical protein
MPMVPSVTQPGVQVPIVPSVTQLGVQISLGETGAVGSGGGGCVSMMHSCVQATPGV